jgi:hypothetical protein
MTTPRTALDVIHQAYKERPDLRLAVNSSQTLIGAWDQNQHRFVLAAALLITGGWVSCSYDILVNGRPICADWHEIPSHSRQEAIP